MKSVSVVVGSTNPVKIAAARRVFEKVFDKCIVVGIGVDSGVSEQPFGEGETVEGAKNRAKNALTARGSDFGVGLEGGVVQIEGKIFECAWVVIAASDGRMGMSGGLYFEIPPMVEKRIRNGEELGPIMDELTGEKDVKKKNGAIGILTRGNLDRERAYEQILWGAMVKFLSPEWYGRGNEEMYVQRKRNRDE